MRARFLLPACVLCTTVLTGFMPGDGILSTDTDGTTVVNTTALCKDVRGFKGTTPVKVYIKKNKVVKVEALPNKETPKFFARAKSVLAAWDGKNVNKARKLKVDGVSGATYSSEALVKNVQTALDYYQKHH